MTKPPSPAGMAQPCAAPAAVPTAFRPSPATLPPSAYVAGAGIIAADGPGVVVQKLDAAFRAATKARHVAMDDDVKAARAILGRLCEKGAVRMSIPASPDDEDMVLSRIIERAAPQPLAHAERDELDRLRSLVNTPTLYSFRDGVVLEAIHQRERWGSEHDAGKAPADWFWLVGHLAGKALHAQTGGNTEKALHHTISTAAALANWHAAIAGDHAGMRPGIDPAEHGIGSSREGGA